jgi:hypothetical protein
MRAGHPHSDAMHTVEEFRRVDFGHMEIRVTIEKRKRRPSSDNEIRIQLNLNNDKEPHEDPLR